MKEDGPSRSDEALLENGDDSHHWKNHPRVDDGGWLNFGYEAVFIRRSYLWEFHHLGEQLYIEFWGIHVGPYFFIHFISGYSNFFHLPDHPISK